MFYFYKGKRVAKPLKKKLKYIFVVESGSYYKVNGS